MTFDADDNLYVALSEHDTILTFTEAGDQSVFADAADGVDQPGAIRACRG